MHRVLRTIKKWGALHVIINKASSHHLGLIFCSFRFFVFFSLEEGWLYSGADCFYSSPRRRPSTHSLARTHKHAARWQGHVIRLACRTRTHRGYIIRPAATPTVLAGLRATQYRRVCVYVLCIHADIIITPAYIDPK